MIKIKHDRIFKLFGRLENGLFSKSKRKINIDCQRHQISSLVESQQGYVSYYFRYLLRPETLIENLLSKNTVT